MPRPATTVPDRDQREIELLIRSRVPIVVVESHEEHRAADLVIQAALTMGRMPYRWTITEGLRRCDLDFADVTPFQQPDALLRHIRTLRSPGVFVLADLHPFLNEPVNVRLIKDIALDHERVPHTLVLVSHELRVPPELNAHVAQLQLALPDRPALERIVREVAQEWARANGQLVRTDAEALRLLVQNLAGLAAKDAARLARNAIYDDGAITQSDIPAVMEAKYKLLARDGVLHYEFETARMGEVGGFGALKQWLQLRTVAFRGEGSAATLDRPKGMLLLGVQGCGKSLAAKATAGAFGAPLLRLDAAALFDKYIGETERKLRDALATAEAMAPCVLWVDELEKAFAADGNDGGVSRRVLGSLLTWMSEKRGAVFVVATANDINRLPPELVRKGRFDEIFFVDLPSAKARQSILAIHVARRGQDPARFDLGALAEACDGFSGAEIEQAVVSSHYAAHAAGGTLDADRIRAEFGRTRPLSVVMAEPIAALRAWARDRTVPCE